MKTSAKYFYLVVGPQAR